MANDLATFRNGVLSIYQSAIEDLAHRVAGRQLTPGDRPGIENEIIAAGFDQATVQRVLKMVRAAEFKRKQAAPGLKVTDRAFGSRFRTSRRTSARRSVR